MPPTINQYVDDITIANTFENQILYRMCRDHPDNDSIDVIKGKVIAIGRIYAANPARNAGKAKDGIKHSLEEQIAREIKNSQLDELLSSIHINEQFDRPTDNTLNTHSLLMSCIKIAISNWAQPKSKQAVNHPSFCSKYLHFHRPNMFPIQDRFAISGLRKKGIKGHFEKDYEKFCMGISKLIKQEKNDDWTLRSLDTELVDLGRKN